ncbi:ABC transporter substrate-binding protein [Halorhodospira sp. 9622]|uniref:ABC transporter substrate-binding protein n=1 Tax=Halorhodospira sp. 9622 TaxID=2899136 RepID=UPI001EE8A062|nr:ABC transporter substrate-binding protein [Halorhodospira sp. 9622]MCG5538770.1 ABC transporter substrate-binding protein [Halorhodospira sp. 9622]
MHRNPCIALVAGVGLILGGCGDALDDDPDGGGARETREVEDMLGRSVEVPESAKRIATVNVDAFRMALHLGVEERLVGIPSDMYGSRFSEAKPIEVEAFGRLDEVAMVGGGQPGSEFSAERVLATEPDLFIYWAFSRGDDDQAMAEQAERYEQQLGVPVVALNTLGRERASQEAVEEQIEQAYRLLGEVSGREERAEELLDFYHATVSAVQQRVAGEQPPRVYLAHRRNLYNHVSFYFPVELLGAEMVTAGRAGDDGEVSAEELLSWDPQHILLHTPSRASRVERAEVLDDERLSGVAAIEAERIHRFKGTYMGWDLATGLIDLVHMARVLYPEAMAGVDLRDRGEEILEVFYGDPGLYDRLMELSSLEDG